MANKWVYLFSEGNANMRELLGGKGANLAEMTGLGLPVPQGFTITTEALPESLTDVIEPVETSGESAYDLTMVYGQSTHLPFAYDCMGDIRWYMNKETGNYGLYMLSNCRMIWQDTAGYVPNLAKPQSTNLYELDYLGRAYNM